jgi:hypothetical protein
MSMTEAQKAEVAAHITAYLASEDTDHPEVFYEIRHTPDKFDAHQEPFCQVVRTEPFEHAPGTLWERTEWLADVISHAPLHLRPDIYEIRVYSSHAGQEVRREALYVATHSNQWRDETGHLHQVGSGGFCWDCLQPDPDLGLSQRGLVRHPVTPEEIGNPAYSCFVCKVDMTVPNMMHELTDHTVIWGEEAHPRCETCGYGYQTATPGRIGYVGHVDVCPELRPEKLREHLKASHKGIPAEATYPDGRNAEHLFAWHQQMHASFPGDYDHAHVPEED